jgi:hypothetical protein
MIKKVLLLAIITSVWLAATLANGASLLSTAIMLIMNTIVVFTIYLEDRKRRS